jgi:flavin reductase (DIM6/NTAB) family NADH-FMN oxidoreductase RutF
LKHEIDVTTPESLEEFWPGSYDLFSWLDYVVTIPNSISLITTRKANGAPNACLQAWGLLVGDRDNYTSLLAMHDYYHTYANIMREGEWCVNYPSIEYYPQSFETINVNHDENDEITDAGLTVEASKKVQAPRIAECAISLECKLEWHRPLYEGSSWVLAAGKVVHIAVDETVMSTDPVERMQSMRLMYNIRGLINPISGETNGYNSLGLLSEVVKAFDPRVQEELKPKSTSS